MWCPHGDVPCGGQSAQFNREAAVRFDITFDTITVRGHAFCCAITTGGWSLGAVFVGLLAQGGSTSRPGKVLCWQGGDGVLAGRGMGGGGGG